MAVKITLQDRQWRRFRRDFPAYLDRRRAELMQEIGATIDHDVVAQIKTQGGRYGVPWAPPSKWTMAKKGSAHQLLLGAIPFIKFRAKPTKVEVFFDGRAAGWSIEDHHDGFTEQPSGQRVTVQLAYPGALSNYKANSISFVDLTPSEVPARRIWPTENYARRRIVSIADKWWRDTVRRVPK